MVSDRRGSVLGRAQPSKTEPNYNLGIFVELNLQVTHKLLDTAVASTSSSKIDQNK